MCELFGLLSVVCVVLLYSRTAEATFLRFAGGIKASAGPYPLVGAHGVAVSPDGRDVYVASFDDSALVVLARNLATGGLAVTESQVDGTDVQGLFRAVSVTVSPDGRDVYVASFFGDAIAMFRRDANNGKLTYVGALFGGGAGTVGLTQLEGAAVSPDAAHVYVASFGDNAVSLLRRDALSGQLDFVEAYVDGENGVSGVFRASAVAVSPDGANVYVVGGGADALAVFQRDPALGNLVFLESHVDGVDGVLGLHDGVSLAVSPDAADVYALGDDGLAHFRRALDNGRLSFAAVQTQGVLNEDQTSGPTSVAVSPDGRHVYVTRGGDDTLAVLERNAVDGGLQFAEAHTDGIAGAQDLAGATTVAVSPDSTSVYVAAQFDDAVAHFQVAARCVGDCDGDGEVTVDEIVRGVGIALGEQNLAQCPAMDGNGDGEVTVDEIILAVSNALAGCS
jgi:DNA-binding beta-propeller fold protein YncE